MGNGHSGPPQIQVEASGTTESEPFPRPRRPRIGAARCHDHSLGGRGAALGHEGEYMSRRQLRIVAAVSLPRADEKGGRAAGSWGLGEEKIRASLGIGKIGFFARSGCWEAGLCGVEGRVGRPRMRTPPLHMTRIWAWVHMPCIF